MAANKSVYCCEQCGLQATEFEIVDSFLLCYTCAGVKTIVSNWDWDDDDLSKLPIDLSD